MSAPSLGTDLRIIPNSRLSSQWGRPRKRAREMVISNGSAKKRGRPGGGGGATSPQRCRERPGTDASTDADGRGVSMRMEEAPPCGWAVGAGSQTASSHVGKPISNCFFRFSDKTVTSRGQGKRRRAARTSRRAATRTTARNEDSARLSVAARRGLRRRDGFRR